jgi:hypothetical protein
VLPPVTIVWACPLSVDAYLEADGVVEVPRPACPGCQGTVTWWSGYRRFVRAAGVSRAIFVRRVRCGACRVTHAVLPAFLFAGRVDVVETIGAVIEAVVAGGGGVRPAAARADVPRTTARGWVRRFGARAAGLAVGFSALAVELGGDVAVVAGDAAGRALTAVGAAFEAARSLPGWDRLGRWRFASAVSGGKLIATNKNAPYLIVGRRRFMAPVP